MIAIKKEEECCHEDYEAVIDAIKLMFPFLFKSSRMIVSFFYEKNGSGCFIVIMLQQLFKENLRRQVQNEKAAIKKAKRSAEAMETPRSPEETESGKKKQKRETSAAKLRRLFAYAKPPPSSTTETHIPDSENRPESQPQGASTSLSEVAYGGAISAPPAMEFNISALATNSPRALHNLSPLLSSSSPSTSTPKKVILVGNKTLTSLN